MIMTNKLLPVALIAALIGGSVGAIVMHRSQPATADNTAQETQQVASNQQPATTELGTPAEQTAYKSGFADGYGAAANNKAATTSRSVGTRSTRVVYRNAGSRSTPRRVYYDYQQPQKRSFWSKHRDKLTVAMGTGAGAAIGGLIGGKKGALIGGLSGAGGSALYTYKLRKRSPSY
jgi:hypothetical protein